MPIYEYRCEACGHEMEKLQKLADAPLTDCPACGQPTLKKQICASKPAESKPAAKSDAA
jgi:putative FmdB family regulatory protein